LFDKLHNTYGGANLICTHTGENTTCSQEGVVVTPISPTSIPTTPTPEPTTGTLLVKKEIICMISSCCEPSEFGITVTGNNPRPPSQFSGSESACGGGSVGTTLSGDCFGTIVAGDRKTCTVTNTVGQ
jgi:hypothetical protein